MQPIFPGVFHCEQPNNPLELRVVLGNMLGVDIDDLEQHARIRVL